MKLISINKRTCYKIIFIISKSDYQADESTILLTYYGSQQQVITQKSVQFG